MNIQNRKAFLDTIADSEGTQQIGVNNGYDVIVGSRPNHPHLFVDYADHPRILVDLGHGLKSTAAGRYQILSRFFDAYKVTLKLPDFGRASQDKIAYQMIGECNALRLIDAGDFEGAMRACSSRWASLPFAKYGQHTNTLAGLKLVYLSAGGKLIG